MQFYREITPLKENDVFVVLDSISNGFEYPIHNHPEYEINLIVGISGTRIVGDSTARYQDTDLVLLGPYLYHKWDGDEDLQANGKPYRVITIQFGFDLFNHHLFQKEKFYNIRQMLYNSKRGIRYHGKTLEEAKQILYRLTEDRGFENVIEFLKLLELLSRSTDIVYLASEGFSPQSLHPDSQRIQTAYAFILQNFTSQDVRMSEVASLANMSDSAFSHFFRKNTNKSFTQFLTDVRIGHACKLLLDSDKSVKQICFSSGFNNLANFNRLFKKYRNCTPVEYRNKYKEKNAFDWTRQVTPWQFVPRKPESAREVKPQKYSTRLVHT